jgi:hypothetical protein
VGDEHYSLPSFREQAQEEVAHMDPGLRVQRAEGLIHKEYGGIVSERASDRDALAHAAGELPWEQIGSILKPDMSKQRSRPTSCIRSRLACQPKGELDIAAGGVPGQERIGLEDKPDTSLLAATEYNAADGQWH